MSRALAALVLLGGGALAAFGYASPSTPAFAVGMAACAIALGPLSFAAFRKTGPRAIPKIGLFASVGIAALLGVDLAWWIAESAASRRSGERAPTFFDAARADPETFHRNQQLITDNFWQDLRRYAEPDPRRRNPYVLIPGHSFRLGETQVRINELGFVGPEIRREKGDLFRIVALGESTTFGVTMRSEDRPWPRVLEARIAAEYACDVRVQVVNAGVPGWTLKNQLLRVPEDILPLEPDVILTYHGYNGFDLLLDELPPVAVEAAPELPERPSRLLQRIEHRTRLWWFGRRYDPARKLDLASIEVDPLRNRYARQYALLGRLAREAGAQPVFSTFNMAVDASSPDDVIRFYERTVPDVRARVIANRIHTRMLRAIGERDGIAVIDSSPNLDGAYRDAYIDIAHFTQLGRDRLAENLLDGLRELLASHPRLRCSPRGGDRAGGA